MVFIFIYLISTFFIIPKLAPKFGRVKIQNTSNLEAHNFFTIICNRNYVKPKLNSVLISVSKEISKELPNIKITYLDANFPFFNGFPLLPHLSHNDGKKIDISFIYEDHNKKLTNLKPSNSGYGIFVEPHNKEINQSKICKDKRFLQYDFTKYLTFGSINKKVRLSNYATKKLINTIVENKKVSKLFIEPHLKLRLKVNNSKIRFHGCKAVRHDDHIHFQIK
ncbi:hypothetical protein [uncultured Polaribacter sp.]|uniref:hypothetical protein n=1 Tax=uncultured Polaribacter sp. TaxID=174711 RepID=UPI0026084AD8|nr:hypothetical protein [uncultured Polaribacter sp.]